MNCSLQHFKWSRASNLAILKCKILLVIVIYYCFMAWNLSLSSLTDNFTFSYKIVVVIQNPLFHYDCELSRSYDWKSAPWYSVSQYEILLLECGVLFSPSTFLVNTIDFHFYMCFLNMVPIDCWIIQMIFSKYDRQHVVSGKQ